MRLGLRAFPATAFPVLATFGLMEAAGVALDVRTVLVAGVLFGIAVDDAIHLAVHYLRGQTAGLGTGHALAAAAGEVGRGKVVSSAIVAAGFLALALHDFLPAARFGLLAAAGMGLALLGDGVLLPALIALADRRGRKA